MFGGVHSLKKNPLNIRKKEFAVAKEIFDFFFYVNPHIHLSF